MSALPRFSCIILSAGNSFRMGRHKALLSFGNQNISFLEMIIKAYRKAGASQVIVVVNEELKEMLSGSELFENGEAEIVVNHRPGLGRFYSLKKGLSLAEPDNLVFVQNVDNPFVDVNLLISMLSLIDEADVVVPSFSGRSGHPVLINQLVCKAAIDLADMNVRLDVFFKSFGRAHMEVDHDKIFANVNTPDDYKRLFPGGAIA